MVLFVSLFLIILTTVLFNFLTLHHSFLGIIIRPLLFFGVNYNPNSFLFIYFYVTIAAISFFFLFVCLSLLSISMSAFWDYVFRSIFFLSLQNLIIQHISVLFSSCYTRIDFAAFLWWFRCFYISCLIVWFRFLLVS